MVPLFVVGYSTQPDWSGEGGRGTGAASGCVLLPVLGRTQSKYLSGKQHGQDSCVGVADRVDADAADHRGDRAVGLGFHPRRAMLQP